MHNQNILVWFRNDLRSHDCEILYRASQEVKNSDGTKEMKFTANATSTRWAVKHLGKTVTTSELFSSKVFTQEVLEQLDNNVIKDKFNLPELSDYTDLANSIENLSEEDENE
jgi:hypothetical protein